MTVWLRIALAVGLVAAAGGMGAAADAPTADVAASADAASPSFAYSSGKCMRRRGVEPPENGRERFRAPESVLTWRFEDVLALEFQVWGNCCPDSERFVVSTDVHGDTLAITVVDTAASLCRCVCPYVISATYEHATGDRYVVTGLLGEEHVIFPPTDVERGGAGPTEGVEDAAGSERSD